ncbi:MAG: TetR/AcrR family transcriptional regulator C-terminal domain-containing protein, partial [Haloechinothrix sp.]
SKVALPPEDVASWPDLVRTLAVSLREVIHTHASVAPLLTASQTLSPHALRVAEAYRTVLSRAGLPDTCAVGFLRTVVAYALGQSLAELAWSRAIPAGEGADELARIRQVTGLLPPGATDAEIRTALWFCADCDMTEQFTLGIDLMIKGLRAALDEDGLPCAVAASSDAAQARPVQRSG